LADMKTKRNFQRCITQENVYFETSHAPPEIILEVISACGADKIIFGSDFKYDFYPVDEVEKIKDLPVSDMEKEKILYKNIAKVLGIRVEKEGSRFQGLREKILRHC
jgi:predicted TIM-barrel fold metal-dependent hydrolase